jgi:hypothetical protein
MTHILEVERGGKRSEHGCNCKGTTAKGAGVTYYLEVEREDRRLDYGWDYKGSRDSIQSGGGEGGQEVRSQL